MQFIPSYKKSSQKKHNENMKKRENELLLLNKYKCNVNIIVNLLIKLTLEARNSESVIIKQESFLCNFCFVGAINKQ